MGNPTIMKLDDVDIIWKCADCSNTEDFEEDWAVNIIQDPKERKTWYELTESVNIRCKKCGSYEVYEEIRGAEKNE